MAALTRHVSLTLVCNTPMLIDYARISKAVDSQDLDLQKDALLKARVAKTNNYQDEVSGEKDQRPGLQAYLKALRKGDTLVVW